MDVLRAYLNSLFAAWPRTAQVLNLKREMLDTMEDKYEELKQDGKSEHEAIGIVISEFGSIDELMHELGILPVSDDGDKVVVSKQSAHEYEKIVRRSARLQAIGWLSILLGVAATMCIAALKDNGAFGNWSSDQAYLFAVIVLFVFVVPAIGLFIAGGNGKDKYTMLENEFELEADAKDSVKRHMETFRPLHSRLIVIAACLGTLSPVALLIAGMRGETEIAYGAAIMLALLGLAIFLFAYAGSIQGGYQRLLQLGEYTPEKKEENRVIGRIATVLWPLAFVVFFVSGFVYGRWDVNWAVFPVTAVLFAAIGGVYSMRRKTKMKTKA
ncbi:permease prefix domain 1-containing protein [Saccharibacillus sacchari]|uniref:Permease prefix domain 1-containing protein n=1 Tax=Saccharibacillus sacchari TaxID=456493 RepID=A0ACC6PIZ9_9BACL